MTTQQQSRKRLLPPALVGMLVLIALSGIAVMALTANQDVDTPKAASNADRSPTAAARTDPTTPAAPTVPATPATTAASVLQPEPLPADQVFSGRGAKVVKLTLPERHLHVAAISHTGGGNFSIWTVDAAGKQMDLLVNEIGNYSGVRPVDLKETPAALKIEADGSWKIQIQVIQKAPVWTGTASGKGSAVLRMPTRTQGLTIVKITHTGRGNVAVWAYGDSSDLLVNDIGTYSGEVLVPPGTLLMEIEADGAWTVEKVA